MSVERGLPQMREERAQLGECLQRHVREVVFADDVGALLAAQVAARRGFNQYMRWKWCVLAHDHLCAICGSRTFFIPDISLIIRFDIFPRR